MMVVNAELLREAALTVKFILNGQAIVFFPATLQHREMKLHGLSYEDDYRGNAVAGLVTEGRVEIRFHSAYSAELIRNLWWQVLADPQVAKAGLGRLHYQGREL